MSKDLMDVNVNDGLATLLEAGEFIRKRPATAVLTAAG